MKPNDQQVKVIEHFDGPCLVTAVPGSGKTACVTARTNALLKQGVDPSSILAITFTNKAADEMKARIAKEVGVAAKRMTICTFHSLCARMIRENAKTLGYTTKFSIYDDDDQWRAMRTAVVKIEGEPLDGKELPVAPEYVQKVMTFIEATRNSDLTTEMALNKYHLVNNQLAVVDAYYAELKKSNAIDFTGLLSEALRLLRSFPDVLATYQKRWKYISVDEVQDTNVSQYEIVKLLGAHGNVLCVGDFDQCIPVGTSIQTKNGLKLIEEIKSGDHVLSVTKRGTSGFSRVYKTSEREHRGKIFVVKTASGMTLNATGNHVVYAIAKANDHYSHIVYLMYKKSCGYRIGRTMSSRKENRRKEQLGLRVRMNQEHADKAWVLRFCKTIEEAAYYEAFYASSYGIPTVCFHSVGRNLVWTEKSLQEFWDHVETKDKGEKLLKDMHMHPDYPFLSRSSDISAGRICVQLILFGNRGSHIVSLHGDKALREKTKHLGWTKSKKSHWRVRKVFSDYRHAASFAEGLSKELGGFVVRKARLDSHAKHTEMFIELQVSSLFEGMHLAVERDGKVFGEEIKSIEQKDYDGTVCDLGVEGGANFVCGGIVCHNSVYGFRFASPQNIMAFEKDFKAKALKLETNYRSTPEILGKAHALIVHNQDRKDSVLRTDNKHGSEPISVVLDNDDLMAMWVGQEILHLIKVRHEKPSEIAIFYRVNFASRVLERALRYLQIPFKVYGDVGFFKRKEIKGSLAILRLLANPNDKTAFETATGVCCRGIGPQTCSTVYDLSENGKVSVMRAAVNFAAGSGHLAQKMKVFTSLYNPSEKPYEVLSKMLERTAFSANIIKDSTPDNDRVANVKELVVELHKHMAGGGTLEDYLQYVSLLTSADDKGDQGKVKLMTMHRSKGLEFDNVFLTHVNANLLPHERCSSVGNDDERRRQIEEERRLLYVAMTRARKNLWLSSCLLASRKETEPSPFLLEAGFKPKKIDPF